MKTMTTLELLTQINRLSSPSIISICSSCSSIVIDDDDTAIEFYKVDGVDVIIQIDTDAYIYFINPSDECYFCALADEVD
jgi:hypothetical protein